MSIYCGIDPGTTDVGYAFIEKTGSNLDILDYGVIHTTPKIPLIEKLVEIEHDLQELIHIYQPDVCGVEQVFFANNQKTAIDVSHARGVTLLSLHKKGVHIIEYSPQQIKKSLTGNGRADKGQMQRAITTLLNLEDIPQPDDAADALGIAYITSMSKAHGIRSKK